jgi:VanZ family protein
MPRRFLAVFCWLLWLGWAGVIVWLSSLTPDQLPRTAFLAWDKLNHFAAFAIGGWLAATAVQFGPGRSVALRLALAVLLVAAFGAFDELRQMHTPGRTGADLHDWIADFLGALAGALFSFFTHARLDRLIPRP